MSMDQFSGIYFDHTESREYCESLGLTWNADLADHADKMAGEAIGLSQAEFTRLAKYFCDVQRWQWSPRTWPWRARLALAIHFLFNPKGL